MIIYCCGCSHDVDARLTDGKEIYPHRDDLFDLPFWKCDACKNYVGCHHKTKNRTRPLGNIPTKALKAARQHIHRILDPLWKEKRFHRREIYGILSEKLGLQYHTAEIRTVEDARRIYALVRDLTK